MKLPKDPKPDLKLECDMLRLELDCGVETCAFEGLVVVAWHADGQAVGKVVNFDENAAIFAGLLRDVWLNGTVGSKGEIIHLLSPYVLPLLPQSIHVKSYSIGIASI